jgi:hypothetical protein
MEVKPGETSTPVLAGEVTARSVCSIIDPQVALTPVRPSSLRSGKVKHGLITPFAVENAAADKPVLPATRGMADSEGCRTVRL